MHSSHQSRPWARFEDRLKAGEAWMLLLKRLSKINTSEGKNANTLCSSPNMDPGAGKISLRQFPQPSALWEMDQSIVRGNGCV